MNKLSSLVTISTLAFQLAAGAAHAEENWSVGERAATSEELVKAGRIREEAAQTEKMASYRHAPVQVVHASAIQQITTFSRDDRQVRLIDGSLWGLSRADSRTVSYWASGDSVVILPNTDWWTSRRFKMQNLHTKEMIDVDMLLGPYVNGPYTRLAVAINYYTGELLLTDGTLWKLPAYDSWILSSWMPGEPIMIGQNGPGRFAYPNILINVMRAEYVEARAY